jgi:hypothetical protein
MTESNEIEFEQPLEEDVEQITVAPTKRKLAAAFFVPFLVRIRRKSAP